METTEKRDLLIRLKEFWNEPDDEVSIREGDIERFLSQDGEAVEEKKVCDDAHAVEPGEVVCKNCGTPYMHAPIDWTKKQKI
jgi:hypothetical protein